MIRVNTLFLCDPLTDHAPRFVPGQVVQHRREDLRGVIVNVDGHCKLDPACYMADYPQPNRDQPWYQLLTDGKADCPYIAEEDLQLDNSGSPVEHHLIASYFERFVEGRYLRNTVEWPGE